MNMIELIRLLRRHLVLLITAPLLLAGLVILLTKKPKFIYASETTLYTGLASGSSIEMDKAFNYFVTNTAFDNLINIINSRETQQQVAIRLLAEHLLLGRPDPKYISEASYAQLKKITPAYITDHLRWMKANRASLQTDPLQTEPIHNPLFPAQIDPVVFEYAVDWLTTLMKSNDSNFVYKLLNYEHPHYSIKAVSSVKALRLSNSDLIRLSYETDDPGICQQTLSFFNQRCISNYRLIRENRSDDVVRYFELQLSLANAKLRAAEDKLLGFNKSNNIINYYEQSKAVAVVKEDLAVDQNNIKAQLAGLDAAIKRLEEKLNIQQLVQVKSNRVMDKKRQLGDVNYAIANAEADEQSNPSVATNLADLMNLANTLKSEIKESIDELYTYQHTTDGLPVNKVLDEWLNKVVEAESLRARMQVMEQRNEDFQEQYAVYAPAGAHIKRIEREISVSEQGYLELLHGLNLAKLKQQDNELSANLKTVDPPYFPLSPNPTKRKALVILAALFGGFLVLAGIFITEHFDHTLRDLKTAARILRLPPLGMFPKVLLKPGAVDQKAIQQRLLDMMAQKLLQLDRRGKGPSLVLFMSMYDKEGKTVLAGNLARLMSQQGKKVRYVNTGGPVISGLPLKPYPFFTRLLGYPDPRIDFSDALLADPGSYLNPFTYRMNDGDEMHLTMEAIHQQDEGAQPDIILVESPALLHHRLPAALLEQADCCVLVCRANRTWGEADEVMCNELREKAGDRLRFVVNGVRLQETESLLGELPRKRSAFRRRMKNLFRLQYHAKNQI
jgi:succinoglycan biosynthesis transport protein ExoP